METRNDAQKMVPDVRRVTLTETRQYCRVTPSLRDQNELIQSKRYRNSLRISPTTMQLRKVQRTVDIWCAGHAVNLKGGSPEGAVMTGIL